MAETGGLVVCTNEGNADLGTSLPPVHIACMGMEKLVPRTRDLGVFLRLLARSATGQPITTYTTHFHGPRPGGELHIVLVDNGRSALLSQEAYRPALHCIRCGACMNTCPVFRRSGGHSYGFTIPGPIGSVLAPGRDPARYASLPHASSLCGSCDEVCPVRIPLHALLLLRRQEGVRGGQAGWRKRVAARVGRLVLGLRPLFVLCGFLLRRVGRRFPRLLGERMNPWTRQRELPFLPALSFRAEWARRKKTFMPAPRDGGARG